MREWARVFARDRIPELTDCEGPVYELHSFFADFPGLRKFVMMLNLGIMVICLFVMMLSLGIMVVCLFMMMLNLGIMNGGRLGGGFHGCVTGMFAVFILCVLVRRFLGTKLLLYYEHMSAAVGSGCVCGHRVIAVPVT